MRPDVRAAVIAALAGMCVTTAATANDGLLEKCVAKTRQAGHTEEKSRTYCGCVDRRAKGENVRRVLLEVLDGAKKLPPSGAARSVVDACRKDHLRKQR